MHDHRVNPKYGRHRRVVSGRAFVTKPLPNQNMWISDPLWLPIMGACERGRRRKHELKLC